jgi:hypothetical protein
MISYYLLIIGSVIIIILIVLHYVTIFLESSDFIEIRINVQSTIKRKQKKIIYNEDLLLEKYIRSLKKRNYDIDESNNNVGMPI